jgi:hypothetical protein
MVRQIELGIYIFMTKEKQYELFLILLLFTIYTKVRFTKSAV